MPVTSPGPIGSTVSRRKWRAATAAEETGAKAKTYYEQWLDAAETLLVEKGVTSRAQLMAKRFAIGSVGPSHLLK